MPEHDDDGRRSRASGHGFTDNLWGKRARALVQSTERLKEANWDQIEAQASLHFHGAADDDDDDSKEVPAGAGVELYAQIEIDWCVISFQSDNSKHLLFV
jgi:hypothetical protein